MYDKNLHCTWMFSYQPGYHYKITFGSVSFRNADENCTKDLIQVRDGQRHDSKSLVKLCTDSSDTVFYSSLPYLSVYFRAAPEDDAITRRTTGGFIMTYIAQLMDRACGGSLTATEGIVQSPNFGLGMYFADLNCIWIIDGGNIGSSIVELTFTSFDVRGTALSQSYVPFQRAFHSGISGMGGARYPFRNLPNARSARSSLSLINNNWRFGRRSNRCSGDFVEIRDGESDTAVQLGTFCGTDMPSPVASSGPRMYIRFFTDSQDNAAGFSASYKIKCGSVFQARNGTIQTPNFPLAANKSIQCEYIIRAPESYAILVKFTSASIGNTLPFNCTKNYIEMLSKPASAWHNRQFCFVPIGRIFSTSGGSFKLIFQSDGSPDNKGFQATYETVDVACGGTLYGRHGSVTSPRHADEYLHNMECRWYIEVPMGFIVRLNFNAFALEEHRSCAFDYISVYETYINENQTSGYMGKYCGELKPPSLMSSKNTMVVVFVTDSSISRSGFDATYEAVNGTIGCDRSFVDSEGYIENYGYPNPITRLMECEYSIHVERGFVVLLTIENATMACGEAYMEIRNGPSANSPSIAGLKQSRLCDEVGIDTIRSQGNMMYLKFKSIRILQNSEITYKIKYEQLAQGCGGLLNSITGALSSPQYPYSSTQPYDCTWHISVASGNKVSLQIGSFDSPIPLAVDCYPTGTRLDIRDGPFMTSPMIQRFCHHTTTVGTFESTSNHLTVRYVLHSTAAATGFLGHYTTVCSNMRLTTPDGRLESPGFPYNAHSERNCFYRIETTVGNLLRLHFTHFKMDDDPRSVGAPCRNTFLQFEANQIAAISNVALVNSTNVTKYCNESNAPSIVYSKYNYIEIHFKSPATSPTNHFALEWTTVGCGGTFTDSKGIVEVDNTTGDPTVSQHECKWTIIAPPGKQVELTVRYLGFQQQSPFISMSCSYDMSVMPFRIDTFHVFNGRNNQSGHSYQSICFAVPDSHPLTITSTSNEMFIFMQYSLQRMVLQGNMLLLFEYKFKDGGCNSTRTASKGNFTSPNFPAAYPTGAECVWLIKVQNGYTIRLTLTTFDLGQLMMSGCTDPPPLYDGYLAIYDGDSDQSPGLGRFCGNNIPELPTVTSSSNVMFVRFQGSSLDITPPMGSSGQQIAPIGFSANYSIACGGKLIANAIVQTLASTKVAQFTECNWLIETSPQNIDDKIYLTISYISLRETLMGNPCDSHYIEIFDGPEANNETRLDRICGTQAPPSFVSTGSAMFIRFVAPSWFWDTKRHFMLTYSASSSLCGGDYYGLAGAFNSPGYPQQYLPNSLCIWTVNNAKGNRIKLDFSRFDLEDSEYCSEDYVEIREEDANGKLLGRFCGSSLPPSVEGNYKLWIKFHSDEDSSNDGFSASYRLVFGGDFVASSGEIASPYYDQTEDFAWAQGAHFEQAVNESANSLRQLSNMAPNVQQLAWWRITVPDEYYVQITFDDFAIPTMWWLRQRNQCWIMMQLELYDGYCLYENDQGMQCRASDVLCGLTLPSPWTSNANSASMRLTTSQSNQPPKFLLHWNAVPTPRANKTIANENATCGGVLVASANTTALTSPGYPNGYGPNLDCQWSITHPKDQSVFVTVTDVDLEPHVICQYDYLVVEQQGSGFRNTFSDSSLEDQSAALRLCNPRILASHKFTKQIPVDVRFRTDNSINGTGFRLEYKLVCGGAFELQNVDQKLSSPNYPNPYALNSRCVWLIKAAIGRTISVESINFQLEYSQGCSKDYLRVINGETSTDAVLGKYCGSQPINKTETTSYFMRVEFVSDGSVSAQGFQLLIKEVKFLCGQESIILKSTSDEGSISTPGLPEPYRHSLDCVWTIQAPTGMRIQFDFDRNMFELEAPKNGTCQYDMVELRDGASIVSPLIGKYCDKTAPGTLFSKGSFLFVHFVSDETVAKKGFRASFKIAQCGGTIIASSGYITSPNYPNPYSGNTKCEWYILVPEGHFISFSFVDIMLMGSVASNCSTDYVEMFEFNHTGQSFGRFCQGNVDTLMTRRTQGEALFVRFVSDAHINSPGFKLQFNASEEVCGGEIDALRAVIMSPSFPHPYPNRRRCHWLLKAPPSMRVVLKFDDLNFPENEMGNCKYDGVRIYNGKDTESPLMNTFCGSTVPQDPVVSTGDAMTVSFFSDVSINGRGFKATIQSEPGGCGGYISQPTSIELGALQLDNLVVYCHWIIVQTQLTNSSIRIKFNNFNLEKTPGCTGNRVTLYAGDKASNEDEQTICDAKGNVSYAFYHPIVHVYLYMPNPNATSQNVDFNVFYGACGGWIRERQGVITNPGFPNQYENHLDCPWLVEVPEGKKIKFTLTYSNLEYQPQCLYDRLIIKLGPYYTSPTARTYCNISEVAQQDSFTSNTNKVLVQFQTDHSRSGGGFRLEFQQVDQGCGYVDSGDNGSITSPGFPNNYPSNTYCRWEIVTSIGFHIVTNFVQFDVQKSDNCTKDYLNFEQLKVSSGRSVMEWSPLKGPYCGYDKPGSFASETEHLRVTFKTDEKTAVTGFKFNWTSVCGATYTSPSGYISSPYYPRSYNDNMYCVYMIMPPEPGSIYTVIEFRTFELEGFIRPGECGDTVEVIELFSNTTVATLCGSSLPDAVSTKGPMQIVFKSDSSKIYRGFLAVYRVSECGGEINIKDEVALRSAVVRSPTFPAKYQNNMKCDWIVTCPFDRVIDFKFTNLSMEPHTNCDYDYVELRDGDNENSTLIGKFCGIRPPMQHFKSTREKMFIRFASDASITRSVGFFGVVTGTLGPAAGCGGRLNLTSTPYKLVSPGGGSQVGSSYGRLLNCEWFLKAPKDKVIKVNVTQFSIEGKNRAGKCFDYLEVYDGMYDTASLIGKYCGQLTPWHFVSSDDVLYMHFATDFSVEIGGFEMWLSVEDAVCGGSITATDQLQYYQKTIPVQKPYIRCRWKVFAEEKRKIEMQIMYMDFPPDTTCTNSYLEFMDVPKTDNSQAVRECGIAAGVRYVSSGNNTLVTAVFGMVQMRSYNFNVSIRLLQECNRTVVIPEEFNYGGRLSSPNYPELYPHNASCLTVIQAPVGYKITVYFNNFTLEETSHAITEGICQYDSLTIIDGLRTKKFCGKNIPPTFTSNGNSLNIQFLTDASIALLGYDLSYTATNNVCGGTLRADKGSITSPDHPNPYTGGMNCIWTLRVPQGHRLQFTITSLSLSNAVRPLSVSDDEDYDDEESSPLFATEPTSVDPACNDMTDRLEILALTTDRGPVVQRLCKLETTPYIRVADGNEITVNFITVIAPGFKGSGFRLQFEQVPLEQQT